MSSQAKPVLLITRRIFPHAVAQLQPFFEVIDNPHDQLFTPDELLQRAPQAQAIFAVATDRWGANELARFKRLKMIATGSVGVNHIDLAWCHAHGVQVSYTPDVLTEATADMGWALMLSAARRVTESERWLREGHWDRWAFDQFLGQPLHRATLGIAGMGRIGSAIARRAQGFEMQVIYHNRNRTDHPAQWVSKEDLLKRSDFLVLVMPYGPATHHFIDAAALNLMKPSAILVNLARGGIVDDAALAQALQQGQIAAAGLDVFEGEPKVHPDLLACRNIVMTPHIGSANRPTREAMVNLAVGNLIAWATSKPLLTPVSA